MFLRPARTIALIFFALLLWGGIGAAIETVMLGYGKHREEVLTLGLFSQILSELLYWRYLAIFGMLWQMKPHLLATGSLAIGKNSSLDPPIAIRS